MPETASVLDRKTLANALWPPDAWSFMKTWAILDAARDERIYRAVDRSSQESCCLFAGNISRQLSEVAPYLVRFEKDDDLANLVLDKGWGNAWGIFFSSQASMETLRKHFRRFLRVTDESGRKLLFRYYDPRVLPIYLPTCTNEELTEIFGPVDRFVLEADEGAKAVEYRFSGVRLKAASFTSDASR